MRRWYGGKSARESKAKPRPVTVTHLASLARGHAAWFKKAPDDATGIARALGHIARAKGMTQVAKDAGLSRESLYRALSAEGNPSFATVLKVARALGVKLHAEAA